MKGRELDNIDKYLLDQMDANELKRFEDALATDEELQLDVQIRKTILKEINKEYQQELKSKLIQYDMELDGINWLTPIMRLAGIALLIVAFAISMVRNYSEDKYAKYDIYEEGIPNFMNEIGTDQDFQMAMNEFKHENYSLSLIGFEMLYNNGNHSDTIIYYLAVSNYREDKLDMAVFYLDKIDENSLFYQKSEYRIAVINYQIGNKEIALAKLRKIGNDINHPYADQAVAFLEREIKE